MNVLPNLAPLAAFARNPRGHPTYLGYFNGFIYGFSMGAAILFPLYAIDQGFSLASQGFIVATPGIVMIMLRLVGGALSDRFGEKLILWFSFATVTVGTIIPVVTATFLSLTVAQLFNGASRSVYWSAAQSYISRSAEGEAGKVMGRQLSFESAGGIVGAVVVGFVAEGVGYPHAFVLTAGLTFAGFLITSSLPRLPRNDQARSIRESLAPAKTMLVKRTLLHAHVVAFTSAAYSGLVMGLFIAFFHEVGYGEGGTAVIRSLNSIGVSVLAYFFGALLGLPGKPHDRHGGHHAHRPARRGHRGHRDHPRRPRGVHGAHRHHVRQPAFALPDTRGGEQRAEPARDGALRRRPLLGHRHLRLAAGLRLHRRRRHHPHGHLRLRRVRHHGGVALAAALRLRTARYRTRGEGGRGRERGLRTLATTPLRTGSLLCAP